MDQFLEKSIHPSKYAIVTYVLDCIINRFYKTLQAVTQWNLKAAKPNLNLGCINLIEMREWIY